MLVLAVSATVIVGVAGALSINGSVLHEAQERVDHDLDTISALYQESFRALGGQMQGLLRGAAADGSTPTAEQLGQIRQELGFVVLNMCDSNGQPLAGAYPGKEAKVPVSTDAVLRRALAGKSAAGTVLLDADRLKLEGGAALRNGLAVPPAEPGDAGVAGSALFRWFACPLRDASGRVLAVVYGGRALNHDYQLVDTMRNIVLGEELHDGKPLGTVTVFLEGCRVATNVLGPDGSRAVGTRVSEEVRREVLRRGQRWRARAWVVDMWYLSGYEPLRNPDGQILGMLYLGLLEAPYTALRTRLIARFLIPVGIVLILGLAATVVVVHKITFPLRRLREGAERIAAGDWDSAILTGRAYTEIDELAGRFGQMRDAIKHRDQQVRERNRELAVANEQLRETNDNYTKTLRFVTHELRAPLAAIQAMIGAVVAGLTGEVSEKLQHSLVRIKRNCEELQDMVKNYLDLARAERGELCASKRRINFHSQVVVPAVEQSLPLFRSRRIELKVDCPPDLTVVADEELMRIALSNYLSNAAKYGREGGQARLEAARIGEDLRVCLTNEGPGFSTEDGQALFGKFSRLRNENTRGKRGSGLGLYLCKQILGLHDGTVYAESEPGQWARFCFRFPLPVGNDKE